VDVVYILRVRLCESYECKYEASGHTCRTGYAERESDAMNPKKTASNSSSTEHEIRVVAVDGHSYRATLRVAFDGVEYIGRLWFIDEVDSGLAFQDHAAIPGSTVDDAVRKARMFSQGELERRCHRALSEKRRFGKLRRATDEMINQIKDLNRVVINLQSGMQDREAGQEEIQQIQKQILEIVRSLPLHAGVEDD